MIPDTRSARLAERTAVAALEPEPLGGGAADGDLAVAGARRRRARAAPAAARRRRRRSARPASIRRSAATIIPRVPTLFDQRPSASIAARSSALASRCDDAQHQVAADQRAPLGGDGAVDRGGEAGHRRQAGNRDGQAQPQQAEPAEPALEVAPRKADSAALTRSARHRPCGPSAPRAPRPPDHG